MPKILRKSPKTSPRVSVNCRKNPEISSRFWLFSFDFSNFFKNYLGYLKIKEAAETLRMVYFFSQCKTFWMVCLGQGWYPKGMHKNAWYLKGFLFLRYHRSERIPTGRAPPHRTPACLARWEHRA